MQARPLLMQVADRAAHYLDGLDERPVVTAPASDLRAELAGPLPDLPSDPRRVIDDLVARVEPGLVPLQSPRYFGYVVGGGLPIAVAADWLATAWDQNGGFFAGGPAAAVLSEISGAWLLDLLALPCGASYGLVSGTQSAHVTCLAAARHELLRREGWDVEQRGLPGAPPIRVIAGENRHVSIDRAVRFLGLGREAIVTVPCDEDETMDINALTHALARTRGPAIVCAVAGDLHAGSFDRFEAVCDAAEAHRAWVHVDGAIGLWAAASPRHAHLVDGAARADSWATDAHKWLNMPFDSGLAVVAHPEAHRAAMAADAAYLTPADDQRDEADWTPEFSRRARGPALYATLQALGRHGVGAIVDGCCDAAQRFATGLRAVPGAEVLNEVVLNQVVVRFGDDDALTDAVTRSVVAGGRCFFSGSTWHGRRVMRISVTNWATAADHVDEALSAIATAAAALRFGAAVA